MDGEGQLSRRQFAAAGAVAITAALAGCGTRKAASVQSATSAAAATPSLDQPGRMAYFNVLSDGEWTGPRDSDGKPAFSIIDEVLAERPGDATPMYVRMTSASASGTQVPAQGSEELLAAQRLAKAGIKPGVAIDTFPGSNGRSAESIVEQAKQILAASERAGGVYEWIFLDKADQRTPAGQNGLNDLQQIIDAVTTANWSKIMINATGFNPRDFPDLPQRTWAMARHFGLLDGNWRAAAAKAVRTQSGAVTSGDLQFVNYVNQNRHGSTPVLKLEIPSQTQRFRVLSGNDQTTLLRLWAQEGPQRGYRIIYPLFVPGQQPLGNQATQYDSLTAGTFWEQRALMQKYN